MWLISKDDAHIEGDTLVADTEDARSLIEALRVLQKAVDVAREALGKRLFYEAVAILHGIESGIRHSG